MPTALLDEAIQRLPRRYSERGNDTFALVKAFASDDHLSQPSLLVLPGDALDTVHESMSKLADGDVPRSSSMLSQIFILFLVIFEIHLRSETSPLIQPRPRFSAPPRR